MDNLIDIAQTCCWPNTIVAMGSFPLLMTSFILASKVHFDDTSNSRSSKDINLANNYKIIIAKVAVIADMTISG